MAPGVDIMCKAFESKGPMDTPMSYDIRHCRGRPTVKSLYSYVSIFLTGFRMGVRVRVRVRVRVSVSVSQWDSE